MAGWDERDFPRVIKRSLFTQLFALLFFVYSGHRAKVTGTRGSLTLKTNFPTHRKGTIKVNGPPFLSIFWQALAETATRRMTKEIHIIIENSLENGKKLKGIICQQWNIQFSLESLGGVIIWGLFFVLRNVHVRYFGYF